MSGPQPSPSSKHQGENGLHGQPLVDACSERELCQTRGVQLAPVLARVPLSRGLVHGPPIEEARLHGPAGRVVSRCHRPERRFARARARCVSVMRCEVIRETLGTRTRGGWLRERKDGREERRRTRA